MIVPNKFPRNQPTSRRLAIVGEAPGAEEDQMGEPFIGQSGRLLRFMIGSVGHSPDQCLLANVCQVRPPYNEIESFAFDGPEIQDGLAQLHTDLEQFQPNCILALGKTAFRALNPGVCYLGDKGETVVPLNYWRGSLFRTPSGRKGIGAYHPAYILRSYGESGIFRFDIARAVAQAASPDIPSRIRVFSIHPSLTEVLDYCARIRRDRLTIGFDIEGVTNNVGITCLSFFDSPDRGIVIPFWTNGSHYWSAQEEIQVWEAVAGVLSAPDVPKILQNALYEFFVLQWKHKIVMRNVTEDIMLKHWELFPEFDKNLGLQCSIYTLEPYYKDERESNDPDVQLTYNGKDSAVTIESSQVQETLINKQPKSNAHYRFNISLLPAFNYMSLRGVKLDPAKLEDKKTKVGLEIDSLSTEITGLLGRPFNAKSTPDKQWLLYDYLGYEPYKIYGRTTKEEVLHRYYQKYREPVLRLVIQLVSKRTRKSDLEKLVADADGRIRSSNNIVGTVTGRVSASSSYALMPYWTKKGLLKWDYTGTSLQTQTKDVRECAVADPGHFFFQCDLAGADAWTVAADLAALGHPTMLEDLKARIKPAKVLLAMLGILEETKDMKLVLAFNQRPRDEIKSFTDSMKIGKGILPDGRPADWKYTCMKRVQHGTNYEMQPPLLSSTIFKDSDGLIDLSNSESTLYQSLYNLRYNVKARVAWLREELGAKQAIQTASGIRRKFYAIRNPRLLDDATVREALSTEPQANTTYACNWALRNLWYDPANRRRSGGLFIEPLIQIHDAVAGQFPEKVLDFAKQAIPAYFNNVLRIHGVDITIPYDGAFGTDWLNTNTGTL